MNAKGASTPKARLRGVQRVARSPRSRRLELLRKAGIVDKRGKLRPPYSGKRKSPSSRNGG